MVWIFTAVFDSRNHAALILAILITQVFAMNLVWNMGMLLLIAIVAVFGAGSFCSLERKIRNMEVV